MFHDTLGLPQTTDPPFVRRRDVGSPVYLMAISLGIWPSKRSQAATRESFGKRSARHRGRIAQDGNQGSRAVRRLPEGLSMVQVSGFRSSQNRLAPDQVQRPDALSRVTAGGALARLDPEERVLSSRNQPRIRAKTISGPGRQRKPLDQCQPSRPNTRMPTPPKDGHGRASEHHPTDRGHDAASLVCSESQEVPLGGRQAGWRRASETPRRWSQREGRTDDGRARSSADNRGPK